MANEIQELKFQVGEAWKGVYSSSTAYGLANVVQDPTGLSIYRSLKSGNVGHPLSNASWWFRIIDLSSIKAESDRIAALNQAIAEDEALRKAAEELRQQHEAERVAAETQRNENEQARISAEQQRVNKESQREAAEQQRISAEQGRVSAESARVQAEQARILAETLRANAEDQRAANEQNRVAAEQQRIERAEQDHQRAESDHATYVDSLGAFDISSYHATDGVLAKYADLTAALGTGGANIPDDLRKGGMSVKFVQSSDNKYVQYRCITGEFTTDVTQWAIADEGVYVENPEFIYVKTDAEGKILWAIKIDGSIYYGAGVPQQVIDYINERIAELSLDEYEDIVAFLDGIINKQPIFTNKKVSIIGDSISTFAGYIPDGYPSWYPHENDRSSDVVSVNDTWWKKLIDATNSTLVVNASASGSTTSSNYIGFSPRVPMLGNSDVIIVALGSNDSGRAVPIGNIDFDAETYDLTQFAPAYIKGIKDTIASYPYARIICLAFDMGTEYQNTIKTIAEHYCIEYIYVGDISDVHPNKAEMQAVFEKIYNTYTLSGLLANKVDKEEGKSLIDADYASTKSTIDNPEFLDITLDAEDKVLEGIQKDGTKVIGEDLNVGGSTSIDGDIKILGNMEVSGISYKIIENPEFLAAWVDAEDKVIFGFRTDGKTCVGDADFLDDIENIKAFLANLNDKDIDWDALSSITAIDNPEYIDVETDSEEKILGGRKIDGTKVENVGFETPKLDIDGNIIENIQDPEGRTEIKTDSEDKILSYRDSEGVMHEEVGIETKTLKLSEEGLTDFQRALKKNGFQSGGHDFSDDEVIELPEPVHYGMLNLIVNTLPTSNGAVSEGYAEYYDFAGNYFKIPCSVEPQGQTSRIFALTGGKGNYTLDLPKDIKFGSWVPQDSFHLKGCAKDTTRGILATSYKFAWKAMNYLNAKPNRVLMDETSITTTNATGDRLTDWPTDARCLPDGFPCEIYVNGEYWGLYSWQLKKHRKNYSMNKKDYKSFFIDADDMGMHTINDVPLQGGFWTGDIDWTKFEIKNPKDLICMDGSAYDGDNPKELIDSTSEVYDSSNKKHKGSAQTKSIIKAFSTKYLEVKALIDAGTQGSLAEAKTKFEEYFDVNACLFVYIFNCTMRNADSINKNTLWGTWNDGKIAPMLWDLDGMYGQEWVGAYAHEPSAALWENAYAVAAWPLALFWTLYETEIKTTYAELRTNNVISIDTWHSIMFNEWVERIGTEAYERDIEKWPETPSYRENQTNTEYWEELGFDSPNLEYHPYWDENTQYEAGGVSIAVKSHPAYPNYCMMYRPIKNSQGICPVNSFYEGFPQVGGFFDSPKRMQKWMEEQLRLCDTELSYNN